MSKTGRLLLAGAAAAVLIVGGYSWMRIEEAREQQQFESALEAARRAELAGRTDRGVCERILPALQAGVPALDEREPGSDAAKRAYRALGDCLMRVGKYQEAAEAFDKVAFYEPQQSRAHGALARALSRAGRHQAALQHAHLSVQLAPNAWQSHRVLARILEAQGRVQDALAEMERAKQLAPAGEQAGAQRAIQRLMAKASGAGAPSDTDE
jgi:tetratricopeptide (TPR) repeat protein